MEIFVELIAEAVIWLCADKWPRVIAFFIIVALVIGGIIFFSK